MSLIDLIKGIKQGYIASGTNPINGIVCPAAKAKDSEKLNGLTAKEVGASGARNLIPYPYAETTHTDNGISWTDNGDGTVTANGTATAPSPFYITSFTKSTLLKLDSTQTYTVSMSNASGNTQLAIRLYKDGDELTTSGGTSVAVTALGKYTFTGYSYIGAYLRIVSGTTVNNLTFRPMLEIGSVAHDFVPYHLGGAEDALKANQASKLRALSRNGADYGTDEYLLKVQMGAIGNDNKFGLVVGDGTYGVKVNDSDTVDGWHIYSSLSELGLDETTATAESIVNAMADKSMLLHQLGSTATSATLQFPYNHSMLKVTKMSVSYVSFECIGTGNYPIYYAYYNSGSSNKWSGWSTQFLPLTGGMLSGALTLSDGDKAASFMTIRTQSDGMRIRSQLWTGATKDVRLGVFDHDSNTQLASLAMNADKLLYANSTGSHNVHHDGNSNKIVFTEDDTTAPAADALWAHL